MSIAQIGTAKSAMDDGNSTPIDTSATPLDTTGATLLVVTAHTYSYYSGSGTPTAVTDSKGNTWTPVAPYGVGSSEEFVETWHCVNPTSVGSGHYVTLSCTTYDYKTVIFSAWSGSFDTSGGVVRASNGSNSGSWQTGSVTPNAGDLIIAGMASGDSSGDAGGPTIDSGFSVLAFKHDGSGMDGAQAALIAPNGTAVNPTWAWTSVTNRSLNIVVFKAAGGGSPPSLLLPITQGARW